MINMPDSTSTIRPQDEKTKEKTKHGKRIRKRRIFEKGRRRKGKR